TRKMRTASSSSDGRMQAAWSSCRHTNRDDAVRIISARLATRREGETMRAARKQDKPSDEMRAEYDFSAGVRGKYAARFGRASNVVVLAPDVADAFKTAKAVNDALRTQLRKKPAGKAKRRPAS